MYPEKGLERRIKKHVKAKKQLFFAICQPGFENVLRDDLSEQGIKGEDNFIEGGLEFFAKIDDCYRLHLVCHTATRFLMRVGKFKVIYFEKLRLRLEQIPWELYIRPNVPLVFNIKCHNSRLYHTGRLEMEFQKGIESYLKNNINYNPDANILPQKVYIRFKEDVCSISLDCSGEPLYKRNYKKNIINAPLRETLAALILKSAKLSEYDILIDPMCGSGTFSMEALFLNSKMCPGMNRSFAFENWPVFSSSAFAYLKKLLNKEKIFPKIKIYASDKDLKALQTTGLNFAQNEFKKLINLKQMDFFNLKSSDFPQGRKLLILNLPYGKRINQKKGINSLYKRIGLQIDSEFKGCGFAIIVPGYEFEKNLDLEYDKKIVFKNGGINVALLIRF